jgi:hypothetical protein
MVVTRPPSHPRRCLSEHRVRVSAHKRVWVGGAADLAGLNRRIFARGCRPGRGIAGA